MHKRTAVRLATVFVCVVFPAHSRAMESKQLVEKYVLGMRKLQGDLQSGHVVCTGKRNFLDFRTRRIQSEQPIDVDCFVDGTKLRFDRVERRKDTKTIITEDGIATYYPANHVIVKSKADQPQATQQTTAFDIRNLGQLALEELEMGFSINWLDDLLQNAKVSDVQEENGICRISWVYANPSEHLKAEIKRTIWIDSARGFAPVRLEMRARPTNEKWEAIPPINRSEVTWKKASGVWIPVTCRMETSYGTQTVTLNLDWKNVNGDVPNEMFTLDEMNLGPNTAVVDERQGKPVLETVLRKSGPTQGN